MPFAQLVIGPPGSGKSTYCDGMHQFLSTIGRQCSIVNLDPANDHTSYSAAIDVRQLVTLEEIMQEDELGPNGGILYAVEELEHNWEWLEGRLKELGEDYVIFDCPGQVELFTHHSSLRNVFFKIQKLGLLLSLRMMLQMDLPHLNILTKIDKLSNYPPLAFNLDFYTEVHDLSYLLPLLEQESNRFAGSKFAGLNKALVELVEDFGLVAYETLAVEDKKSMMHLLQVIDRAGGYAFGAEGANDTVWQVAMREGLPNMDIRDIQERWIDRKEEFDDLEKIAEETPGNTTPALTEDVEDADDDSLERSMEGFSSGSVEVVRR